MRICETCARHLLGIQYLEGSTWSFRLTIVNRATGRQWLTIVNRGSGHPWSKKLASLLRRERQQWIRRCE
jgi:hypothetical protein